MTFAISIGAFLDVDFVRLNLAYLRKIYGDETPIVVCDGAHANCKKMERLAEDYGCGYVTEEINRGHFAGDLQNTVSALALAQANKCDIAIKTNQRLIQLHEDIPMLIENIFTDQRIDIALPGQCSEKSIVHHGSRFHSRFHFMPDILFFRANRFNPQKIIDGYCDQLRNGTTPMDSLIEMFWAKQLESGRYKHEVIPWLTEHTEGEPFRYLRKCQNSSHEYAIAARDIGLNGEYCTDEWKQRLGAAYRPAPRA